MAAVMIDTPVTVLSPEVAPSLQLKGFRLPSGEVFAAFSAREALGLAQQQLSSSGLTLMDVYPANHTDLSSAVSGHSKEQRSLNDLLVSATAPGYLGNCFSGPAIRPVFVEDLHGLGLQWAMQEASFRAFGFAMSTTDNHCEDQQRHAVRRWIGDVVHLPSQLFEDTKPGNQNVRAS